MKNSHLTLRLPAALVRALTRRAREADVPRAQVVREAVTAYLDGRSAEPEPEVTATVFAVRWRALPRLPPNEAEQFAIDLAGARDNLPAPRAWE